MSENHVFTFNDLKSMAGGAITVIEEYKKFPEDSMNLKLNPKTWSAAEVCRHLIQFNCIYLDLIENAINKSDPEKTQKRGFKPGWMAGKMISFMEPPYKIGVKTISPLKPQINENTALDTFNELINTEERLIEFLDTAENHSVNLDKLKAFHPVFKVFRMSVTEYILLLDAHQRRHFWQIEQILKRLSTD